MIRTAAVLALAGLVAMPAPALAKVPTRVGKCVSTRIAEIGTRLEGVADSGSAVEYANGLYGVSYKEVRALKRARRGDRIRLCLTSVPKGCPAGDDRGKVYKARDLRTGGRWELPDSEHMCGGA